MNDTRIASKAKAQLANFTGKVFAHFPKPSRRFIEECIYGIQASGDTRLSSVVRAIDDDIRPIHTGKRPGRNLDDEAPGTGVSETILAEGARGVRSDTLLLVAPTEGQAGVLRLFPRGKARFHHPPEGTQRPFAGGDARGARACATVRHAPFAPCHVRLARTGMQRAHLLRSDAREDPRTSRQASAHGRRKGLRPGADDARHVASRQRFVQVAVARGGGASLPMEDRGDHTLRQTVVRLREHPRRPCSPARTSQPCGSGGT